MNTGTVVALVMILLGAWFLVVGARGRARWFMNSVRKYK